jgi:hypothetical protein
MGRWVLLIVAFILVHKMRPENGPTIAVQVQHVANAFRGALSNRNVFSCKQRPNLIDLNPLASQVDDAVLIPIGGLTGIDYKAANSLLAYAGHGTDAVAFTK